MGTLDDLINAEVDRFTNAVKGLLKDHIDSLFASPAPQTTEEQYPSTVTPPTGPVTVPDATLPAPEPSVTAATAPDPGVVLSPGGDAQTVPDEPPAAPETTLGGQVVTPDPGASS